MDKKKILIVDDETDCCDFFKNYFTRRNFYVDLAYDGLQAKHLLEDYRYDYIFFDCNMPGLSGVELSKVIIENNPQAKKIMISGYALIKEDFAQYLGIDAFLRKPITFEDIEKIMKND